MYTVIDETGKVLYCRFDISPVVGEISIIAQPSEPMDNPHWDFETQKFYSKPIENE